MANPAPNYANVAAATAAIVGGQQAIVGAQQNIAGHQQAIIGAQQNIAGGYQVLNTELPRIQHDRASRATLRRIETRLGTVATQTAAIDRQLTDIQRTLTRIEARTTKSEARLANLRIKNRNTGCFHLDGNAATLGPLVSLLTGDIIPNCPATVGAIGNLTGASAARILRALGVAPLPATLPEKKKAIRQEFGC